MAFNKEIFELAKFAAQGKGYVANSETYSAKDVESSLKDEIKRLVKDYYSFQKHKYDVYELIATTVDAILPERVEATMGQFAEIVNLAQGQKQIFKKKLGRTRAKQFIGRVSPAGIYETFRLDSENFEVYTHAIGGGARIDFERYLDGVEDWSELVQIILDGLEADVYKEVALELQASYNASGRPANTKYSTGSFVAAQMRNLVNTIRTYGDGAVIFATAQFINAMDEAVVYSTGQNPSVSPADIDDLRRLGRLAMFYGAPILEIPNAYEDETNTTLQINPEFAFILPTSGQKIVKVVFEGDTLINDLGQAAGDFSMEMHVYKKFGTAIMFTNNWGIYQNTALLA
ncbi:MAG: hypothetical protein M0R38_12345 [Bacteroidia bacterium]|nr:hypothetical protein [Bacteroidia bacterium]